MAVRSSAGESFISCSLIPKVSEEFPKGCRTKSLKAIYGKLVWPVVALFPDKVWARVLNVWRWSVVLCVIEKFEHDKSKQQTDTNERFVLSKHVATRNKIVVTSDAISLNCSTNVDSDVDISFSRSADEFQDAVIQVLTERCSGCEGDERMSDQENVVQAIIDQTKYGSDDMIKWVDGCMVLETNIGNRDMQRAFKTILDIEFFSSEHQFHGDNAVVDGQGQLVPFVTRTTWEHSKRRIETHSFGDDVQVPSLQYPENDLYLRDGLYARACVNTDPYREEHDVSVLLLSDGYFARPAFMYVAKQYGIANTNDECAPAMFNVDVVKNSYRALLMVAFENMGFALEYIDHTRHGLCPTLEDRAQKIAKYARRISDALIDIRRIRERNGLLDMFEFYWWETAGRARGLEKENVDSFNKAFFPLKHYGYTCMDDTTLLIREIVERKISELLKNVKYLLENDKNIVRQSPRVSLDRSWPTDWT